MTSSKRNRGPLWLTKRECPANSADAGNFATPPALARGVPYLIIIQ